MHSHSHAPVHEVDVSIPPSDLPGILAFPENAQGIVVFAHGSGSSRLSPRNKAVASDLHDAGMATLLFDLLSPVEGRDQDNIFDIPLLAARLETAIRFVRARPIASGLPVGLFGASTGAAAALVAAGSWPDYVAAVVSRGGRPDLAGQMVSRVRAPVLLIVGEADARVLQLNREAKEKMPHECELVLIPGATHLFEEPGAMEEVSLLAVRWFKRHLRRSGHV